MDRIEWLRQQITARLAAARGMAVYGATWHAEHHEDFDYSVSGQLNEMMFHHIADLTREDVAAFLVLNDPRDTVARCEAELAILDHCIPGEAMDKMLDSGIISAEEYVSHEVIGAAVVRHLASAYRHHAGYEDHWGTAPPK